MDMVIKKISLNSTSYDIRDSRVTDNVVNGSAAWTSANSIAVTNAANGNVIKESGVSITTTLGSDNTSVPTSLAVKNAIEALPSPMIFKGSLGESGTITTLPTASASNTGYTYKVITAGTYASQAAKVGDTFISDGTNWILIPSGDEPSGTVISITAGTGLSGGTITTSGTIDLNAATSSTLGGVIVGSGLSITDGILSVGSVSYATVANKIGTGAGSLSTVGGAQNPVYFSSGEVTACSFTMWSGTQSEYDQIQNKDANTYYFIKES